VQKLTPVELSQQCTTARKEVPSAENERLKYLKALQETHGIGFVPDCAITAHEICQNDPTTVHQSNNKLITHITSRTPSARYYDIEGSRKRHEPPGTVKVESDALVDTINPLATGGPWRVNYNDKTYGNHSTKRIKI